MIDSVVLCLRKAGFRTKVSVGTPLSGNPSDLFEAYRVKDKLVLRARHSPELMQN